MLVSQMSFRGKPMAASQNVSCFLRLVSLFCSEGELVEYWVRHFFSDFESKQLRFASQVSVFFPLRSVISFLFRGF